MKNTIFNKKIAYKKKFKILILHFSLYTLHLNEVHMSKKMWGGRFSQGPSEIMKDINASIDFDRRLYAQDIMASKAHARMLAKRGIIADVETELRKGNARKVLYTASESVKKQVN